MPQRAPYAWCTWQHISRGAHLAQRGCVRVHKAVQQHHLPRNRGVEVPAQRRCTLTLVTRLGLLGHGGHC